MLITKRLLAGLLAIGLMAVGAQASTESDIKSAAKDFATALGKGDAADAKSHATSDENTVTMIDVLSPVVSSSRMLHDAAVAKFGKDGETVAQNVGQGMSDWTKHADDAVVTVNGDSATLAAKAAPPDKSARGAQAPQPLHLKKDDGKWKVDFSTLSNAQDLKAKAPTFTAMAKAMSETADEVKAGEFQSAAEAKQALGRKVQAALRDQPGLRSGRPRGTGGAGGAGGSGSRNGQ